MTGPTTPEGPRPSDDGLTASEGTQGDPEEPTGVPGLTAFSLEGRHAPALFVVGWLSLLIAVGLGSLALFGPPGTGGSVLWLLTFAAAAIGLVLLGGSESLERRAAGLEYAGPSPMVVLLAALMTTQVAGFAVGFPLQAIGTSIPRPLGDLLAVGVQALVFLGVVRLMVVGTGALSWRDMGIVPGVAGAARAALGGAVFAGPVIFVTTLLALLVVAAVGVVPASPLPPTGTTEGLLLHLAAGAVIAPIAEEVLFRGFALTAWRRLRGTRAAIVRSSVVFVLAHVLFVGGETFGEAIRLAFVAGVVRLPIAFTLAWLFVRTGSLWGPIGLHAAFNGLLITLAELGVPAGGG